MIHLLYQELSDVYRTVLLSFFTLDHFNNKQGAELLLIDHKLANKQIRIGEKEKQLKIVNVFFISSEGARKLLLFLSKDEKETFFRGVRNMFQSIASYLKSNLPLNNSF